MTLRIGILGGNFGVNVHVPAFQRDQRCRVWGLWTRRFSQAQSSAKRLKIPFIYKNWRDLVDDPRIDVVAVALPPLLQSQIIPYALKRGKSLFLEKPLTANWPVARRIESLSGKKNNITAMDFEFPDLKTWSKAKQLLSSGHLGALEMVTIQWILPAWDRKKGRPWKHQPHQGGGLLHNFGSHSLQAVEWFLGSLHRLRARLKEPTDIQIWMETKSGIPVFVRIAREVHQTSRHELAFFGQKNTLVLDNRTTDYINGFHLKLTTRAGQFRRLLRERPERGVADGRVGAVASVVKRFLTAVSQKKTFHPSIKAGIRVEKIMQAVRLAHEKKTWVGVS